MLRNSVTIAIDDIYDGVSKTFKLEEAKDPEKIRYKFKQEKVPEVLCDVTEGDDEKQVIVGSDLEAGHFYVWRIHKKAWEDKEIVQNALKCSMAVYEENPLICLKNLEVLRKTFHTVEEIVAFGKYATQLCLIVLTKNDNGERMLLVTFRGSQAGLDWKDNLNFGMETDDRFVGKIHGGFLERKRNIDIRDIQNLSVIYDVNKIITCGHSLGGAVSSLVHLSLLNDHDEERDPVKIENIINVTFGAPFIGNKIYRNGVTDKDHTRNMFHFVFEEDSVPSLLSIGHTFKTFKEKLRNITSDATLGFSEVVTQTAVKWSVQNSTSLEYLEKAGVLALEAIADNYGDKKTSSDAIGVKDFLKTYEQCKKRLEVSTLQNEYEEHDYVPIGRYILIRTTNNSANGVEMEILPENSKIVERILTAAIEHSVDKFEFKPGHVLDKYNDLIKQFYGGFQKFHHKVIKLNKTKIENLFSKFEFQLLCTFVCGFQHCNEANRGTHLYENEVPLIFCRSCQYDVEKEEYFFHEDCSREFHHDKLDHLTVPIDYKMYENSDEEVKQLFQESYDETRLVKYVNKSRSLQDALNFVSIYAKNYFQVVVKMEEGIKKSFSSVLKLNAIASAGVFAIGTGYQLSKWWRGEITGKTFFRILLENVGGAVGSCLGSWVGEVAGGSIGFLFGGPVGALIGAGLGGLFGGHASGSKIIDFINKWWMGKELSEDEQKADAFVESMLFLRTSNIRDLSEKNIKQCFRKRALLFHPDKLPQDASEDDKKTAMANWITLDLAQQILLKYCEDSNSISEEVKDLISQKFQTYTKEINILKLQQTIEKLKQSRVEGYLTQQN